MSKRICLALATALLLTQGVALYGLAGAPELGYLFAISFLLLLFLPQRNIVSAVASFFVATLLVWGMISMSGLYDKNCYRPDQLLITYDMKLDSQKHKANANISMTQAFGDLGAMTSDPTVPRTAREVSFRTDAIGFRNDAAMAPDDVVLIGDSFIEGSGNTQDDTLASVLKKDFGIASYGIGAPGDLFDYSLRAQAYAADHEGPVFLFMFEGNDFDKYKVVIRPVLPRYVRLMHATDIGKFFRLQMARLKKSDETANVTVLPLDSNRIALYSPYIQETRRTECKAGELFLPLLKSLNGVVDGIFFIPTKYRVYAPLMGVDDVATMPNANWEFLSNACKEAGMPCYNLTGAMQAEAEVLWRDKKELLWWADDTHWNRNGVIVAARAVADVVNSAKQAGTAVSPVMAPAAPEGSSESSAQATPTVPAAEIKPETAPQQKIN